MSRLTAPVLLLACCLSQGGCLFVPYREVREGLPFGAMLTQESGPILTYTATAAGTIFVRDQPADLIIFQTRVDPGQHIEVDGDANRLSVDGRPVQTATILRPDATYQLYFKPADRP